MPITDLGEGWWVPSYTLEKNPDIKTVLDILERPDLFPAKEDPSKGEFIGCPAGWGCQLSNINLFRAFEMEKKGWILVDPGSQAGLDASMAKAVERGDNWFGYYWAPTAPVGRFGMKMMDFGVPFAGAENWDGCIAKAEQDCADPKPSSWTQSEVHTVVTTNFKDQASTAMDYFAKRIYPGDVMGKMLVYMDDNQAQGIDAAIEFLEKYEVDISASFFCRFAGGVIMGAVLMQLYILFRGTEATWAFFNFMFIMMTLIAGASFYGFEIDKLGLTKGSSREGYISTGVLAILWAILSFGLADKIYI